MIGSYEIVGAFLMGIGVGGIVTAVALAVAHWDDEEPRTP